MSKAEQRSGTRAAEAARAAVAREGCVAGWRTGDLRAEGRQDKALAEVVDGKEEGHVEEGKREELPARHT